MKIFMAPRCIDVSSDLNVSIKWPRKKKRLLKVSEKFVKNWKNAGKCANSFPLSRTTLIIFHNFKILRLADNIDKFYIISNTRNFFWNCVKFVHLVSLWNLWIFLDDEVFIPSLFSISWVVIYTTIDCWLKTA